MKTTQAPGATPARLQSRGLPAGGAGRLGGAGGNKGEPGGPPYFPFRFQEEPRRCRLGPSGLCLSLLIQHRCCAAPRARTPPGESATAPTGDGARGWRETARRRGVPGAWRLSNLRRPNASENPPGTRRPRGLMERRSVPGERPRHAGLGE